MSEFFSILRQPDLAIGATDTSSYRFEEKCEYTKGCPVKFDYKVENNSAKIIVYPSGSPVKFLKLRFNGDLSFVDKVFSDQWERSYTSSPLEWRSVMNNRVLPWYCYLIGQNQMACYGVKTGPDCFAFWQVDTHGITLILNLKSGENGTDLAEPLLACEVVELISDGFDDAFIVAERFAGMMCENNTNLPKAPIFGVNNWYWAYGRISKQSVLEETDYLLKMTQGVKNAPYMIIDDGWQLNRTYGKGSFNGGDWVANTQFGCMGETADEIHAKGAKAGLWFRPLLTLGRNPDEAILAAGQSGGQILDPSHPFTLEKVFEDTKRIHDWGYELIKHDFSTIDIVGRELSSGYAMSIGAGRNYFDKTKTTATIIKNLYLTIEKASGDSDVIGCNTISHLTAGIHSTYRVGQDTSGKHWAMTVENGVNSMMRLPLNEKFYLVDPDCAAFTDMVDAQCNLGYLEVCALCGMTTLASVTPGILTDSQLERIRKIFKMADDNINRYTIANFDKNASPDTFVSRDKTDVRKFDWTAEYGGMRFQHSWFS